LDAAAPSPSLSASGDSDGLKRNFARFANDSSLPVRFNVIDVKRREWEFIVVGGDEKVASATSLPIPISEVVGVVATEGPFRCVEALPPLPNANGQYHHRCVVKGNQIDGISLSRLCGTESTTKDGLLAPTPLAERRFPRRRVLSSFRHDTLLAEGRAMPHSTEEKECLSEFLSSSVAYPLPSQRAMCFADHRKV
jgi:hypothetical protein